jgi:hypothetical protein
MLLQDVLQYPQKRFFVSLDVAGEGKYKKQEDGRWAINMDKT